MASKVKGIQIEGLDQFRKAFKGLPSELEASVIRNIARKPSNKIVSLARKLFTRKDTGVTKRTIGILKVRDRRHRFLEIGVRGKSLAWIHMLGAYNRKKKDGSETGDIKPLGNVIEKAANQLAGLTKEFAVDINKVIVKGLKKYLRK